MNEYDTHLSMPVQSKDSQTLHPACTLPTVYFETVTYINVERSSYLASHQGLLRTLQIVSWTC